MRLLFAMVLLYSLRIIVTVDGQGEEYLDYRQDEYYDYEYFEDNYSDEDLKNVGVEPGEKTLSMEERTTTTMRVIKTKTTERVVITTASTATNATSTTTTATSTTTTTTEGSTVSAAATKTTPTTERKAAADEEKTEEDEDKDVEEGKRGERIVSLGSTDLELNQLWEQGKALFFSCLAYVSEHPGVAVAIGVTLLSLGQTIALFCILCWKKKRRQMLQLSQSSVDLPPFPTPSARGSVAGDLPMAPLSSIAATIPVATSVPPPGPVPPPPPVPVTGAAVSRGECVVTMAAAGGSTDGESVISPSWKKRDGLPVAAGEGGLSAQLRRAVSLRQSQQRARWLALSPSSVAIASAVARLEDSALGTSLREEDEEATQDNRLAVRR